MYLAVHSARPPVPARYLRTGARVCNAPTMFSILKGDTAPRSRQSSVDSQAIGPHPPTPDLELGTSLEAGASYAGAQASGHFAIHSAKRSSVFNLRSRSNTANSTAPSLMSPNHPDMADHDGSWNGSPLVRLQPGGQNQSETSKAGTRRSFFRGRKGKRNSEATAVSTPDFAETDLSERRTSMLRKDKRRTEYAEDAGALINQISKPFDFQHLSHTDRHQIAALEKASAEDLASGSQATRATRPSSRGLHGAKTDDLHFRNFSSDNVINADPRSTSAFNVRSYLRSPPTQHEWQQSDAIPQLAPTRPHLRSARSVESFSQPGVSPRKHEPLVLASPPRSAARRHPPVQRVEAENWHDEESKTVSSSSRSKRESGVWDSFMIPGVSTPDQQLSDIQEDSYFGHALTTPDDSAIHAMTPPFSPSLADVAEEPERFASPRPAPPPPPGKTPSTPRSPYFETFSFANHHSMPTRARSDSLSQTSPHASNTRCAMPRPSSQMSDTLGYSGVPHRDSLRENMSTRRTSNTWRAIEESWEDDVDYIYENALEADCDSAWDRAYDDDRYLDLQSGSSRNSMQRARYTMASQDTTGEPSTGDRFSGSFRTSLLVPSTNSLPDLAPASAMSASTTSTGLPTPCNSFSANRFGADEGFVLTPSLLIPEEYKDAGEVTYEDLLDEYNGSDRHFPLLDASQSVNSSTRSSRVRFSRRSSYDSSMMSSIQSSGLWSSPVRRSASSAGSVPDLVPSRRARQDQSFSMMIDKLSEQVAGVKHFDQSTMDDDVTPPGRHFGSQTFFTVEEDAQGVSAKTGSILSELKESLELARHGSQRRKSTAAEEEQSASQDHQPLPDSQRLERSPVRQHKLTLSDGAAKLLSESPVTNHEPKVKARNRAATTTAVQQPMLRLFPTPPRHTTRS
ncbi:hypothetical protein IAQ61_011768 [Plenodomus lingam]|uniref:uncharacterized protein n=1 Tax=Leptosphaeria maculans TaxID=5022 RepID=UPI00332329A6|nr:hypothetical protein IAQ61_011768 [Plenodomus lingam]